MDDFEGIVDRAVAHEDPVGWLLAKTDLLTNPQYDVIFLLRMIFARLPQAEKDRWVNVNSFIGDAASRGAHA